MEVFFVFNGHVLNSVRVNEQRGKKLIDEVNVKSAVHYSPESSHVIETRSIEHFIFYPYEIVV